MSMDFDFSMFSNLGEEESAFMIVFLIVYLVTLLLASVWGIVVYVLQSVGLHTIAKRRGIHHPGLAWVPIANIWILGSISDQYQFVAKGRIRNRRKVLLGLCIGIYAVMIVFFTVFFSIFLGTTFAAMDPASADIGAVVPGVIGYIGTYMVLWVLSVVYMVFWYIAYYDLYASCSPSNAVMFLILSIFFNFLQPFFVFANRKKDEGMPPRKVVVPVAPWQPVPPPPAPDWQNPAQHNPPPVYQYPVYQPPVEQPSVWQPAPDILPQTPAAPAPEQVAPQPPAGEPSQFEIDDTPTT